MGLSECLANYEFIGNFNGEMIKSYNNFIDFNSIISMTAIKSSGDIDLIQEDRKFLKVHLPLEMKEDRELLKSGDFIVEANGKKITARVSDFVKINELEENIVLF
jgi:CRISPR-associated protein Cas5h